MVSCRLPDVGQIGIDPGPVHPAVEPDNGLRRRRRRRRADRPPLGVIVAAGLAGLLLVVPLLGLAWRAPWATMGSLLAGDELRTALRLSLLCALCATILCAAIGLPLAWLLARWAFPGRRLVRALALLPMVMPPVVGGIALLAGFGRAGLVGQWLDRWFAITLPFTTSGAVLAETFVALPFLVVTAEAAFGSTDRRLEEAARTLGAGRWTVFRRVVLPSTWPSLAAGLVLCWARALGEFGATITFAGNFPGRTRTMPIAIYLAFQARPEEAIALSLVLLTVSVAVLVGLRERWLGALR